MAKIPTLLEQNLRAHKAYKTAEQYILEKEIKPRISKEIIDEHKNNPIGKHSDNLERVLIYFRKNHLEMEGKYILVCTKPHEEWRIAELSGKKGVPPKLLDDVFDDRFEAEHGLFLKRLEKNNFLKV